jgi:hypothetical protein
LLDDPANDNRPFSALSDDAANYEVENYIKPRLTDFALKNYPLPPESDPGFLRCEPWGVARQIFAQHQLEIRQRGSDVIEMRYGEWDAKRVVYMNKRNAPVERQPTRMGRSIGRYEGDALVIETTDIAANITRFRASHSDQLRIVERYTRSRDGKILYLAATFEDPVAFRQPMMWKKMWSWAPRATIAPYTDCELPTGLLKKVN